ncbi:MAG: CoB--CoM heterodisulfide reductase iron-sulfur subunit B family protein [Chloroflexi bacterium]|nr:CoB--CoM heterodisulfide reductase iron-sulfur subunit B family protein [Chloroflexota bacterium]MCL5075188.1 CoB--CoM heterodisulfide reductase iron-sulfur subunit B family protein [Chloroflexota bacterium]
MKYSYFPGCSLQVMASEYNTSARAVMRELDVELKELEDWNCCGATNVEAVSYLLSIALPARNLALAEAKGYELVATCSSCFLNLFRVKEHIRRDPTLQQKLDIILGAMKLHYAGTVRVRHLLDVLVNDIGLEKIAKRMRRKLTGLRVVPYYGCQIVRPYAEFDGPDLPVTMDRLIIALGAEVVPYLLKTKCCGGALTTTRKEIGLKLIGDLLLPAVGTDCVITVCPLCQLNLDAFQSQAAAKLKVSFNIPILYFTQLIGLAFGLGEEDLQLAHNIVSVDRLLTKLKASRSPAFQGADLAASP